VVPLQLIFGVQTGSVGPFIVGQDGLQSLIEEQFYAKYPDSTLDRMPPTDLAFPAGTEASSIDLMLTPDLFRANAMGNSRTR
jgi:hypothetical protein